MNKDVLNKVEAYKNGFDVLPDPIHLICIRTGDIWRNKASYALFNSNIPFLAIDDVIAMPKATQKQMATKDGKIFIVDIIPIYDDDANFIAVMERMFEITHHSANAITDALTGAFNRRYLEERLVDEINRFKRYSEPFSIALIDIDFFKTVNDTYGHGVGDKVLRELTVIIQSNIRNIDIAGRYGGDEFLLILPYASAQEGVVVSENLQRIINVSTFSSKKIRLTLSIGVAEYLGNLTVIEYVRIADEALYASKKTGRDKISTVD